MNKLYFLSLFLILFLGGCVNNLNNTKCDITQIEKSLTKDEKKKLYTKIQFEIDNLRDEADTYYAKTYYLKALESYELINFYNGKNIIPLSKIERIKKRIKANQVHYYNKATNKKLSKNKVQQLFYLNELMRNNPKYKDGEQIYKSLREDPEIVELLQRDKDILYTLLEHDSNNEEQIFKLNNILNKTARYDDMDPLVIKGKELLKQKRYILHKEAVELYKKKRYSLANKKFDFIKTIYKKDRTSDKYLNLISKKNKLTSMESKAFAALEKSDYQEAINLANKMLTFNNKNTKALNIFNKANSELKKEIPKMIRKAVLYYSRQEYKKALNIFQNILKLDSGNNTALTYSKKIKAQLRTIESLQTN